MGAFTIEGYNCVFIHIPKTAGTSIRRGVFKNEVEGPYFNTVPEGWEDKFSFAFVRNPYDRMISAWKMFSGGMIDTKWGHKDKDALNGISLMDFLKIATDESIDHHKRDTIYNVLRHHTIPQTSPYHCIQFADFIGKFENLESDFALISNKIGLKDYSFNHLNKTARNSYKEYYNEESFEFVTKNYREEIEQFGYEF
ncbi:sulfotransferase family 2 domain-containing protein [Patiriisocius sp. Uisw_047]|jgi:hypothetical protein|uniref:sulfotransferase family 2 domain-containing protein n=1 Tax=Patiriisocius sp. Uisw_047 TaxID=3230969 RepID=UPI0039E99278